jgi:hypothetical protein
MFTLDTATIYIQNNDHSQHYVSVHDGSLMPRQTRLAVFLIAPWKLVSSAVADQLLILLLTRWGRPPAPQRPPPQVDPISLRVHAFSHSPVRYNKVISRGRQPLAFFYSADH